MLHVTDKTSIVLVIHKYITINIFCAFSLAACLLVLNHVVLITVLNFIFLMLMEL